jgi:hypothetical protein
MEMESFREKLVKCIKDELGKHKSCSALARAIKDANPSSASGRGNSTFSAKKLQHLDAGQPIPISLDELEAFDAYLDKKCGGRRVADLLAADTALEALARSKRVLFLYGAKPVERGTYVSCWDVRALTHLMRAIQQRQPECSFEIQEVPLYDRLLPASELANALQERWGLLLEGGPSVVCLGSTRACLVTELLLSQMFTAAPFRKEVALQNTNLPFLFLWSRQQYEEIPSTFARPYQPQNASAGSPPNRFAAMSFSGEVKPVDRDRETFDEYAVVAAQRRTKGQIFAVVAGLTGPGTFAAAQLLDTRGFSLPDPLPDGRSRVAWIAVKAAVRKLGGRRIGAAAEVSRDDWELTGQEVIGAPAVWSSQGSAPG